MTPLAPDTLRNLPGPLPEGEDALWQGSPRWTRLALGALHVRLIALYFVALAAWQAFEAGSAGAALGAIAQTALLGGLVMGLAVAYAWFAARSTTYTITTRRVLLTFGIALPVTLNVPFKSIGSAAVRLDADGTGDIPLGVTERKRMSYFVLWPHVRPWRLSAIEPMLRAVPDAARVARILGQALVEAQGIRSPAALPAPAAAPDAVASPQPARTAGADALRPAAA